MFVLGQFAIWLLLPPIVLALLIKQVLKKRLGFQLNRYWVFFIALMLAIPSYCVVETFLSHHYVMKYVDRLSES
ncbi:hypothetical protein GCM10025770_26580 [Viridibacterium curvum]|uniref:Uncharacterized protein n=1 Tax=Viridibacterium curvum TaxID=1101404 RepID=A0ABP9QUH9_9RHOO